MRTRLKAGLHVGLAMGTLPLLIACGGLPGNPGIQERLALESFQSCASLETHIEDAMVLDMRSSLERQKQGGWGWPILLSGGSPELMVDDQAAAESRPADHTTTNVQVDGVDEADFVKNDGTRIFALSGGALHAATSWPPEELAVSGRLPLEGRPLEMYLDGDTVTVFSEVYAQVTDAGETEGSGETAPSYDCYDYGCGGGVSATRVTAVDVSDLGAPRATGSLVLSGRYVDSRRVEGEVRVVTAGSLSWPAGVQLWLPYDENLNFGTPEHAAAIDALMDQNEGLIRERTLDEWLEQGTYEDGTGESHPVGYDCADFRRSSAPVRPGLLSVNVFSPSAWSDASVGAAGSGGAEAAGAPELERLVLLAQPGTVYANRDALYVTTPHWWWSPGASGDQHTYLHKFDLSEPGVPRYSGSGGVEGHVLNQFSMDEHEGHLRVATTTTRWTSSFPNFWTQAPVTHSRVSVFGEVAPDESGPRLERVGQTGKLAEGESIQSARFLGHRGYVVTFRQVDPLFALDLSDPREPRVLGELKVPGFSSYLHPFGEDHLIGLGIHIPEPDEDGFVSWDERRVKLSLFDVSDPAQPVERAIRTIGNLHGHSEALWDHKAFNLFASKGLLAVPFTDWVESSEGPWWGGLTTELHVFEVDVETGFTPKGTLAMTDVFAAHEQQGWGWYWSPQVRRSVMADDYVYAISDAGIRVAELGALDAPLTTALFEPPSHEE